METIRQNAAQQLESMRQQIAELNDSLRIDPGDIDLPPCGIPRARTKRLGSADTVARLTLGLRRAVPQAHRVQGIRGGPVTPKKVAAPGQLLGRMMKKVRSIPDDVSTLRIWPVTPS
jgi:hypothetical protein